VGAAITTNGPIVFSPATGDAARRGTHQDPEIVPRRQIELNGTRSADERFA